MSKNGGTISHFDLCVCTRSKGGPWLSSPLVFYFKSFSRPADRPNKRKHCLWMIRQIKGGKAHEEGPWERTGKKGWQKKGTGRAVFLLNALVSAFSLFRRCYVTRTSKSLVNNDVSHMGPFSRSPSVYDLIMFRWFEGWGWGWVGGDSVSDWAMRYHGFTRGCQITATSIAQSAAIWPVQTAPASVHVVQVFSHPALMWCWIQQHWASTGPSLGQHWARPGPDLGHSTQISWHLTLHLL